MAAKFDANPLFSLDDAPEIAAVLGCDGSGRRRHERRRTPTLVRNSRRPSPHPEPLFGAVSASAHLHGDGQALREHLDDWLASHKERFNTEQRESMFALLERVANINGAPSTQQRGLLDRVRRELAPRQLQKGTWA